MKFRSAQISLKISLLLALGLCQLTQVIGQDNSTSELIAKQHNDLNTTVSKKAPGGRGREGRMLNLDVMAGELGKDEKTAQERLMSGNRQSRILTEDIKTTDDSKVEGRSKKSGGGGGGKKMSIKGFIPIVSLDGQHNLDSLSSDSDSEADGADSEASEQNNLRDHLSTSYGGQTSIGHASFAPQQQQQQPQLANSNTEWQQYNNNNNQDQGLMQPEAARANRKLLGSAGILSGLTGGPGKRGGLVSSLVPPAQSYGYNTVNYQQQQPQFHQSHMSMLSGPMNMPPVQAGSLFNPSHVDPSASGECICVPFFQCKNGFLSESQLSKSQLAQINQMMSGPSGAVMHQIPRSLSGFKGNNDLPYLNPTVQNQMISGQQSQNDQQQQQQQQQQQVNEMIYDQLRKSIESQNLEQQLQQQEAYNQANQQHLSLIDERSNANKSSSGVDQQVETEGRSLLNPLASRRQFHQSSTQKCGIMRTCCRIPPRSVRSSQPMIMQQAVRPSLSSAAARFVHHNQLVASPSISRPQNQYQMLQPMRQQHQPVQVAPQPQSIMQDFNQQLATDAYPMTALQSSIPPRPNQHNQVQQASGAFMQGRCGIRSTLGISGRVQNADALQPGAESSAEFGEFPAHAAILKRLSPGDSLFVCSAVLISSQWLATAAHCVRKSRPDELKIRLGEWDVNRDDEFYPFFESNVREIVLHPDFQPSSLINDIALLRIEQAVDQQQMPHIAPACLASSSAASDQQMPMAAEPAAAFNGQRCWVTGWGKDAFGQQGTFQSVLKKVDLPVVGHQECEQALKYQTRLGKHFRLHASNICAGGERGKDACEGDGGAGLYCLDPVSGLSKAVGLVSWGVGCGQRGVPGVYVSLAHFGAWIEHVVATSGEENVYLDARINGGLDPQAFKSIISERSNLNVTAAQAPSSQPGGTPTQLIDAAAANAAANAVEARQAPATNQTAPATR